MSNYVESLRIAAQFAGIAIDPGDAAPHLRDYLGQSHLGDVREIEDHEIRTRLDERGRCIARILFAQTAPRAAVNEYQGRCARTRSRKQVELLILGRAICEVRTMFEARAGGGAASGPSGDDLVGMRRPRALIVIAIEFRLVVIE